MKIKEILKKIKYFFKCSPFGISKYVNWYFENPFSTWWQARKYFKCPNTVLYFSTKPTYYRIGKFLDIKVMDVSWKDKWGSPRYEYRPKIEITLFRRITFGITCGVYYKDEFGEEVNGDMEYWEYLLTWLYYKKKKTLKCYPCWVGMSWLYSKTAEQEDSEKEAYLYIVPTVAFSLNKRGIKQLKEELR